MNILDLFKKPKTQPLPVFPLIKMEDIPAASAVLFYGGNKLTELAGNRLYKHPYVPPAFHAAVYIERGLFLNVGKFKTVEDLATEFRSTRRVDVVIYKDLTTKEREILCHNAYLDTSHPKVGLTLPDYAVTDYLRFGLKFLKPSKKDFCSENVAELFTVVGHKVAYEKSYDTAPWDILEYALDNPAICDVRTLHIGPQFHT